MGGEGNRATGVAVDTATQSEALLFSEISRMHRSIMEIERPPALSRKQTYAQTTNVKLVAVQGPRAFNELWGVNQSR
jgi:hypothetical protein